MVASPRAEVKQDQWAAALEELLEEVRLSILKDSATDLLDGDPRLQTIFERVSEKLTEAPGEGGKELSDAKSAQRLWTRQWKAYAAKALASIERRAHLKDQHGQPRVRATKDSSGSRQVELADWRGRVRARVFTQNGEPTRVHIINLHGKEDVYTQSCFGLEVCSSTAQRFQCTRQQCLLLLADWSAGQRAIIKQSLQEICKIFPRLEVLFQRELREAEHHFSLFVDNSSRQGRQLDLEEMSFDPLLAHLETQIAEVRFNRDAVAEGKKRKGPRRAVFTDRIAANVRLRLGHQNGVQTSTGHSARATVQLVGTRGMELWRIQILGRPSLAIPEDSWREEWCLRAAPAPAPESPERPVGLFPVILFLCLFELRLIFEQQLLTLDISPSKQPRRRMLDVGEGSFGKALLVRSEDGQKLICKMVDVSKASRKEMEDAVKEGKLLSELKHPYIVRYRESFTESGWLCILMDYCEGGDLTARIAEAKRGRKPLSEDQILRWFVQAIMALDYIHKKHVLHRDLKPSNFFLSKSGNLKMGDFGIAKVLACTIAVAKTQIGTPYYLSPELCQEKEYNFPSDIWAMGCILYELCARKVPFDAPNIPGLVREIVRGTIPSVPASYSPFVRELVSQMLNRNPERRPSPEEILAKPRLREIMQLMLDEAQEAAQAADDPAAVEPHPEPASSSSVGWSQAGSPYRTNDMVEYYSVSHGDWLPATVLRTDGEGRIIIDLKPNTWLSKEDQATKVRRRRDGPGSRGGSPMR
ncbi:NEK1 [Symbiodinium sp. KB8]|nr:NEK1 [Symbiodinium sp. KB8]